MNLYPHQIKALYQTKNKNHVAYYLDMGLGKTFVGSEKSVSFDEPVILVICQKSKVQDWIDHFRIHYLWIDDVLDLTNKKMMELFIGMVKATNGCTLCPPKYKCVAVINYDLAFRRPDLLNLENFTLMLDESSMIQNEKAKRTKFILKMKPKNVILLSGTPTSGKYEKLWSQMHLLGWNISLNLYHKQYINWNTIKVGGVPLKVVDKENPYKNVDRLKSKMREHGAIFMKTDECFELPEQTFTDIKVNSSQEYRKFKKDRVVILPDTDAFEDDIELVGDTTLTQMLGERELCGIYSSEKQKAFADLLQSTNDRLIVFYNFNGELDRLRSIIVDDFKRPCSEVNGYERDLDAYEKYDNSVTLIQYQAGSMGLNLQKANKVIYYTLPLMSELFEQSKKRIHRIGQNRPCFYYTLTVKNSIEGQIKKTLEMRKDFTDKLFEEER